MATFQLVTVFVALALFTGSSSASVVTSSSTSLVILINEILDQSDQPGGVGVTTLRSDAVQLSALAKDLYDSLPNTGSALAVALNNLVQAADLFIGVPDTDAALTTAFDHLISSLQDVRGLLPKVDGKLIEHATAARRKRRVPSASEGGCCSCCGKKCCGGCCSCKCG